VLFAADPEKPFTAETTITEFMNAPQVRSALLLSAAFFAADANGLCLLFAFIT